MHRQQENTLGLLPNAPRPCWRKDGCGEQKPARGHLVTLMGSPQAVSCLGARSALEKGAVAMQPAETVPSEAEGHETMVGNLRGQGRPWREGNAQGHGGLLGPLACLA